MKKAATPPGAAKGKKAQSPKPRKTSKAKTVKPVVVKPTGNPVAESKNAKVQKVAKAEQKTVSKPDTDKRGRGHPTDYKPEYCEIVRQAGRRGLSVTAMAEECDQHRDTLYEWAKVHPEFSDALSRARQSSQAWWEKKGQDALDYDKFQAGVWTKSMSCRFPEDWRDNSRVESTGKDGGALQVEVTEMLGASFSAVRKKRETIRA